MAEPPEHELVVFLFTDILDSSGLKVRLGDFDYATRIAQPHNDLFRAILARYSDARNLGYTGDGFVVMFSKVANAVETALLFHHALSEHSWEGDAVQTRIGIHLGGTVILARDGPELTIASHAADMCSRVMSLALGGQTLLTRHAFDDARQYVRAHPPIPGGGEPPALAWAAHGPYSFKGRSDPLEVFEVGAIGLAPLRPPPDADKARRAIRPGDEETLGWRPAQGIEIPGRPGWRLLEQIGEGGFGEVWLAEQERLKEQRVFKFCFDEERLRSFKRELTFFRLIRDALGERRDIARLYDLKLDAPPFFLESEFAAQGNLAQWCERHGGIGAIPFARRLEIVAGVADAVGAAHSVGILHKDIKPQNVLMQAHEGGEDTPQLTDFGIGALANRDALEAHQITAAGLTENTLKRDRTSSMTRLYAPPEQLTGKPYTVQGDIFALGVVLYQIVAGDFARALAPGWERDVDDPLLREDIATCVDGDPARRLASAAELATRLRSLEERRARAAREREQLLLEEELAAAQTRAQAEHERLRRTRRIAALVGVLALAAIVAGFAAQRAKVRAQRAEAAAEHERQQAELGRKAADLARQKEVTARQAAEGLIRYMQYDLHERLGKIGQLKMMEGVNTRVRQYREEHPGEAGDLEAEREKNIALSQRGDLLVDRGQFAEALASFRQGLAITEKLTAQDPANTQWQRDHWSNYVKIGDVLRRQGKLEEALQTFQAALAINQRLVESDPTGASTQLDLALNYQNLGDTFRSLRQFDAALKSYRESVAIRERGAQLYPTSSSWPRHLALGHTRLAEFFCDQGSPDQALASFRAGLAIYEPLVRKEPANLSLRSNLANTYDRIGDVLFERRKFDEALPAFQAGLNLCERLAQQDPESPGWTCALALSHGKIGQVAAAQERWPEAAATFQRELEIARPWLSRPENDATWVNIFSTAAGRRWEIARSAPPGTVVIDRAAALEDLRTAREAGKKLSKGQFTPPLDKTLPWLEKLLQEAAAKPPGEAATGRAATGGNNPP